MDGTHKITGKSGASSTKRHPRKYRGGHHEPYPSLSARVVVRNEPVHGLLDPLLEGRELVVREEGAELLVAGRLLVLAIRLRGVADHLALEVHRLRDRLSHKLNRHLRFLVDAQDDRLDGVVVPQRPHRQPRKVLRVYELPQRGTTAPDG